MSHALTYDETREALQLIAAWRQHPDRPVVCPRCGGAGLAIEDRSARPHAEWYALACGACGLAATLHIPLSPPAM